jgi:hypothetical protein
LYELKYDEKAKNNSKNRKTIFTYQPKSGLIDSDVMTMQKEAARYEYEAVSLESHTACCYKQ